MITIYAIVGLIILFFLFRFFLVGRVPRFNGLSKSDLDQYLKYLLQRALENNGTVHVDAEGYKLALNITKREYSAKPTTASLTLSSGYIDRHVLGDLAETMSHLGYDCQLKYTKSRNQLHRVIITTSELLTAPLKTIEEILKAGGAPDTVTFSGLVYGPLKPGFAFEDGIVVKRSGSYRIGRTLGFIIGKIWRLVRGA